VNIKKIYTYLILVLLFIFGYMVYGNRPFVAEPWQWADDGLYWQQAEHIKTWLCSNCTFWLGDYSQTILSKTPLFAFFLVGISYSLVSLHIAEFILLILLSLYVLKAFGPMCKANLIVKILVISIIIFNPYLPGEVRLLRTALSCILTGFFIVSLIGLIMRSNSNTKVQILWSCLSGFFLSLCYLCREEGVWLVAPALLTVLFLSIVNLYGARRLQAVTVPVVMIATFFPLVITVCTLNLYSYGAFVTTDRRAPEFVKAYKLLASLEPENNKPYVPMAETTRMKVYSLSPTFAKLKVHLEGKVGDSFATNLAHLNLNGARPEEREFFVSNFEFALRTAVWEVGIKSYQLQEAFWKSVFDEVKAGVAQRELKQGNMPLGLCAPIREGDTHRVIISAFKSFMSLMLMKGANIPLDLRSSGNEADVSAMGMIAAMQPEPIKKSILKVTKYTVWRQALFNNINKAMHLFYYLGILSPLIVISSLIRDTNISKNNIKKVQALMSSLLCITSIALFCLMMGVLEVCGWPHLKYGNSYNSLGLIIISVNACVGIFQLYYMYLEYGNKIYDKD
jgi:hypothetical protein